MRFSVAARDVCKFTCKKFNSFTLLTFWVVIGSVFFKIVTVGCWFVSLFRFSDIVVHSVASNGLNFVLCFWRSYCVVVFVLGRLDNPETLHHVEKYLLYQGNLYSDVHSLVSYNSSISSCSFCDCLHSICTPPDLCISLVYARTVGNWYT